MVKRSSVGGAEVQAMRVLTPKQCINFEIIDYGIGTDVMHVVVDEYQSNGRRHRRFDAVAMYGRLWNVGAWDWMTFPNRCLIRLRRTDKPDWYRGSK